MIYKNPDILKLIIWENLIKLNCNDKEDYIN